MKHFWLSWLLILPLSASEKFPTKYEQSQGTESATYTEGMAFYRQLAATFPTVSIREMGLTDSGEPLHLVLFSATENFDIAALKSQGKLFLMINNAIHAGEPDGVDACMMFLRDLAMGKTKKDHLDHIVIGIIPFYNIGGVLNRNRTTRVNQLGPKAYGFRGNARNFDLNRDFIKNDSRNARSFAQIFHLLDPEVYLETHVTNGSDHQYVLTLVTTQSDKLGEIQGQYLNDVFEPQLMRRLASKKVSATPYVNVFGTTPDKGFPQFLDGPRYSTGYAALFQTVGFMTETHSLKPFKQRVLATRAMIECLTDATIDQGRTLRQLRERARRAMRAKKTFPLHWALDRSQSKTLTFRGFASEMRPSEITPGERLKYHRNQPFEKEIPFFNHYKPQLVVNRPHAYLIPRGWHPIIDLLKRNGIAMTALPDDRDIEVEIYHIDSYETADQPYEGHYVHYNTQVRRSVETLAFHKGDWVIPTDQPGIRYLVETLEPQAPDSFFSWNYFDTILQQKEYFSGYVFEDIAAKLLEENPGIKAAFENQKAKDSEFAASRRAQLHWLYLHSPHYEKAHMRYPVYRVLQP